VPGPEAELAGEAPALTVAHTASSGVREVDLKARIGSASFAFRGYDVTNLGRTPELLDHPAYGPVMKRHLDEASSIAAEALGRPFDLAARVRAREGSSLASFAEDVATIVAVELAQLALLDEFFGVRPAEARQSIGYSIGELAAVVSGGMFTLEQILRVPLSCADDCAEIAAETTLGVLFSRGPALSLERVQTLCTEVSGEGQGMVGVSTYLSPNTILVIGQGDTLDRLERAMPSFLPPKVMLRRKPHKLPPLHTPLVWQRNIPNRAATALYKIAGPLKVPAPPVISCVTGSASYTPRNARDTLIKWVDHPQLLWDVIDETLRSGVDLLVHAGPAPNLIPATFERLSNNVAKQLGNRYFQAIGHGVGARMNRHAWLARLLPSRAALLRAPYLEHVILEDWLLEQKVA
jgi:[acyl-carrier-protein] S-malonyltransferase